MIPLEDKAIRKLKDKLEEGKRILNCISPDDPRRANVERGMAMLTDTLGIVNIEIPKPKDHIIDPSPCSFCGAKLDRAYSPNGHEIEPGDFSICIYCRELGVYDNDMKLRKPTEEEYIEIAGSSQLREYSKAFRRIDKAEAEKNRQGGGGEK